MITRSLLMVALFTLPTCHKKTVVAPEAPSAAALGTASDKQLSKASAAAKAAETANLSNPAGPPKEAVAGELSVVRANVPTALAADDIEAMDRVNRALAGDLESARKEWDRAKGEAAVLQAEVSRLKSQVEQERLKAASELQRRLDEIQREADNKQRTIITFILFGGSALCIIGAVLLANLSAAVPMFGPRAALGLGIAGGVLFALGIAMRVVERMISEHPYVFWGSLLGVVIALAAAGVLVYSNHHHNVSGNPDPVPTP